MVIPVTSGSRADPVDLVVVGAGIVGLAHAVEAIDRGMSVTVVDRDERAVGASIRNFGHGCLTAQAGEARAFGERARRSWLRMAREAGFWAAESGTLVVARAPEEQDCLDELAQLRGPDEITLLTADQVRTCVPVSATGLLGGALLPRDIRVDPRAALPAIADWVDRQPGARVLWSTPVTAVETGGVRTPRGDIAGDRVVLCLGHDLDRLLPTLAEEAGVLRCTLQMLQIRAPGGITVPPALLTGSSLLRYPAFTDTEGAAALRQRWRTERPELIGAGVNHVLTQRPDGDLIVGDTHAYARTPDPFSAADSERLDELVLAETRRLFGVPRLDVVHRWQGTYAAADSEFLRAEVAPGVMAVVVTTGIGMTTAFGLAPTVLDRV